MQEQGLKIVRFSEEFSLRGHFAGPEAVTQAYVILEQAACYVSNIGKREENLQRAISFFTSAEQVSTFLICFRMTLVCFSVLLRSLSKPYVFILNLNTVIFSVCILFYYS